MNWPQLKHKFLINLIKAVIFFLVFTFIWVWVYVYVNPPVTAIMLKRKIAAQSLHETTKLNRIWVSYNQISPNMILAAIASEDQNFAQHNGFDFKAIEKAIAHNQQEADKEQPRMKGASTISQQVAKNVFLWESRNWLRKGLEAYFTVLIEALWDKKRIMEVYLNVAETGKMTFGVEAAAQKYFGKSAQQLTLEEAALIAVALPNPVLNNPTKPGKYMITRKNWITKQVQKMGGKSFLEQIH